MSITSCLPLFERSNNIVTYNGDRFDFFCPTHDELCCKRCITTTHNEYKGTTVIEDFVEYSKSSAAITKYEQTLKDIDGNIQTAIDDRKCNLDQFEKQKQAIRKQIKNKRIEINKLFDNLEATLVNELSAIEGVKKQNVQSVIEKLKENKNKNLKLKKDVDAMKKYGSNIQVLMGTMKFQQPVLSQEKFVRSLQDDGSLRFVTLECSISEELNNINTRIRSFGTVKPITSKSRVRFSWESDKSAQIMTSPTDMHSIDKINTKRMCKIDDSASATITSCLVGKYVMFSNIKSSFSSGRLLQYDSEGKYLKKIMIENSCTFDILFIDSETVAVTGGDIAFNVYIVDVATLQVKRVINVGNLNWVYGATYKKESIIGCINGKSIKSFNVVSGKAVNMSALSLKNKYAASTYLASDAHYFYHSDHKDESVTCYEIGGKIICRSKMLFYGNPVVFV